MKLWHQCVADKEILISDLSSNNITIYVHHISCISKLSKLCKENLNNKKQNLNPNYPNNSEVCGLWSVLIDNYQLNY